MADLINLGGRPPIYDTPESLLDTINDYFNNGVKVKTVIIGKAPNQQTVEIEVPTITGLCLYAGFESRQSFYDYEKRDGFSYIIKRARLFIEKEYEENLSIGNTTGAIFALKNMGWFDKQELQHSGEIKTGQFDYSKLSDATLRELANASGSSE